MPVQSLFRFADRTHFLVAPALILAVGALGYGVLFHTTDGDFTRSILSTGHVVGTLALFTLLPAYLVAMLPLQRRRTQQTLDALRGMARPADVSEVEARMNSLPRSGWALLAAGAAVGLALNPLSIERMLDAARFPVFDVFFIAGACLLWGTVALMLVWRVPVSRALSRLGENLDLDLYRLDKLRPLARVANADVLTAVGAMAFMPLQSLDAEFRLGNYILGFVVGTGAVAFLFLVPLWGVHRRIVAAKAERLRELHARIDRVDRADLTLLETVTAHVDRVRSIPNWPIDIQLVTRLFGYVIIPPLAWVAAALVENFVNSF